MNNNEINQWKIVRNRSCIRALLIFFGVVLMQVAGYMICVLLLMLGAYIFDREDLVRMLADAGRQNASGEFLLFVSGVSALLSAVWCGVLYKKSQWREEHFNYRKAFSLKNTVGLLGLSMGSCIVITMVLTFLSTIAPQLFEQYKTVMDHLTKSGAVLSVVYVLLIGPVSEELIFRGAILDRFYLAFPYWIANVIQAVLFGVYHMNLIQGIYAFLLGIMLGLIRYVTKSILSVIIAHIVFNATSYLLGALFPEGNDRGMGMIFVIVVCGGLIAGMGLRYYLKKYKEQKQTES